MILRHETFWLNILDDLIQFKKLLKGRYGLLMKEEIHASVFISKRVKLQNTISRNDRLDMLKKSLDCTHSLILQMTDVVAYFARQVYEPNKYLRKKGARTFYGRLTNVINPYATKSLQSRYKIVEV